MTGPVIEAEQEDAGEELMLASILLSLLLLRYAATLRRLTAAHMAELQTLVLVAVTKSGITDRRRLGAVAGVDDLIDELDAIVAGVYVQMLRDLQRQLDGLAQAIAEHQTRKINEVVGVPAAVPVDRAGLSAAVAAALVAGAGLAEWMSREGGSASFRFSRVVRDTATNGLGATEAQAGIKAAVAAAQRSAEVIAATAVTAAHAAATAATVAANAGVTVRGWQHCSVIDGKTSDLCRSRAGLKWLADGTPVGHSRELRRPPLHPNCRSSLVVWLMSADDMPVAIRRQLDATGKAGRLTGRAPKEPSLDDFLRSRTEAEQKEILGLKQWRLWKAGKITQSGLLDQSSRPLTLAQLRRILGLE